MHIRTFLKPLSFLPAILVMYMIYSFSAQDSVTSSDLSYKVSYQIIKTADQILDSNLEDWQIGEYAVRYNGVTRKIAHMGEYFLLAVTLSFPLYVYGLHGILLVIVSGFFCIAFACADEYHQSFVSGRSPGIKDVCIDSVGILVGIILVRIVGFIGRKTVFRPIRDDHADQLSRREIQRLKKQQARMRRDMDRREDLEKSAARQRSRQNAGAQSRLHPKDQSLQVRYVSSQEQGEEAFPGRQKYDRGRSRGGYIDDDYDDQSPYGPSDAYYDDFDSYDDPEEAYADHSFCDSSDDLDEDMPLSHILKKRRR